MKIQIIDIKREHLNSYFVIFLNFNFKTNKHIIISINKTQNPYPNISNFKIINNKVILH